MIQVETKIDTTELVREIARTILREIKPLLNNRTENDTIFTVGTLSKYLCVSPQWVYERVHLREIPHIKMGKFPRFKKSDIDNWLNSLKTPAINPLSRRLKAVR